jgi:hypothetical protein
VYEDSNTTVIPPQTTLLDLKENNRHSFRRRQAHAQKLVLGDLLRGFLGAEQTIGSQTWHPSALPTPRLGGIISMYPGSSCDTCAKGRRI